MPRRIKVLDHGFVELRNIAGPIRRDNLVHDENDPRILKTTQVFFDADDTDAPNAARMSFNQSDKGRTREQDMKLAAYLIKNKHTSPFEMVQIWLEMKMPIFVARQFIRHRTARVNEMSARYVTLPAEWYIPETVGGKAASVKQGQADNLDEDTQNVFKMMLESHCHSGYERYLKAIEKGVAAEHARMLLSLNHYTHWLWNQDLHNMMHLLSLRDHSHAQVEAQAYAKAIDQLIREVLPETMALYDKHRRMKPAMTREQATAIMQKHEIWDDSKHNPEWVVDAIMEGANG